MAESRSTAVNCSPDHLFGIGSSGSPLFCRRAVEQQNRRAGEAGGVCRRTKAPMAGFRSTAVHYVVLTCSKAAPSGAVFISESRRTVE